MWPRMKYTQPKSPGYNNPLLIFIVNLAGSPASGLLEREEMSSSCTV